MSNGTAHAAAPAVAHQNDARHLVVIITRAQSTLADPARWTRGALARTVLNRAVSPASDYAWAWSTSGALALAIFDSLGMHTSLRDRERFYDLGISSLWCSLPDDHPRTLHMSLDIDGFNDYPGTTHQDITLLFERALIGARADLHTARPT